MLARLALLVIALPAAALAADQAAPTGRFAPPPSPAAPSGPATPSAAGAAVAPAVRAPPPSADPAECRLGCAKALYACDVGERTDGCGGGFSQCAAACDLTDLKPGFSTAP